MGPGSQFPHVKMELDETTSKEAIQPENSFHFRSRIKVLVVFSPVSPSVSRLWESPDCGAPSTVSFLFSVRLQIFSLLFSGYSFSYMFSEEAKGMGAKGLQMGGESGLKGNGTGGRSDTSSRGAAGSKAGGQQIPVDHGVTGIGRLGNSKGMNQAVGK